MSRIKKEEGRTPKINIEHIKDQSSHPELQLSYKENMVGVCLGGSDKENAKIHLHCDKSKDRDSIHRSLRKLNPLSQNVEGLIKFTRNGEFVPNDADEDIEYDIETLNLNEYFLKKSRCDIIDELQERYSNEARRGRKREFLNKEKQRWSSCNRDGNLPEYNLVALKFIDKKIKKLSS